MAKIPVTSVADALKRWEHPLVRGIHTEITEESSGLWGGSVRIDSLDGEIEMIVTRVATVRESPHEVHAAFDQVRHAPSDAEVLAEEVLNLREQVRRLKAEVASRSGE